MLKTSARIFPIGFIISVDASNFDPHDFYIGGTWERVKGKVIVGLDENQTEFNATGKTGGSKYTEKHSHVISNKYGNVNTGSNWASISSYDNAQAPATGTTVSQEFGTGNAGNLQPYQTAYVWKLISYSN